MRQINSSQYISKNKRCQFKPYETSQHKQLSNGKRNDRIWGNMGLSLNTQSSGNQIRQQIEINVNNQGLMNSNQNWQGENSQFQWQIKLDQNIQEQKQQSESIQILGLNEMKQKMLGKLRGSFIGKYLNKFFYKKEEPLVPVQNEINQENQQQFQQQQLIVQEKPIAQNQLKDQNNWKRKSEIQLTQQTKKKGKCFQLSQQFYSDDEETIIEENKPKKLEIEQKIEPENLNEKKLLESYVKKNSFGVLNFSKQYYLLDQQLQERIKKIWVEDKKKKMKFKEEQALLKLEKINEKEKKNIMSRILEKDETDEEDQQELVTLIQKNTYPQKQINKFDNSQFKKSKSPSQEKQQPQEQQQNQQIQENQQPKSIFFQKNYISNNNIQQQPAQIVQPKIQISPEQIKQDFQKQNDLFLQDIQQKEVNDSPLFQDPKVELKQTQQEVSVQNQAQKEDLSQVSNTIQTLNPNLTQDQGLNLFQDDTQAKGLFQTQNQTSIFQPNLEQKEQVKPKPQEEVKVQQKQETLLFPPSEKPQQKTQALDIFSIATVKQPSTDKFKNLLFNNNASQDQAQKSDNQIFNLPNQTLPNNANDIFNTSNNIFNQQPVQGLQTTNNSSNLLGSLFAPNPKSSFQINNNQANLLQNSFFQQNLNQNQNQNQNNNQNQNLNNNQSTQFSMFQTSNIQNQPLQQTLTNNQQFMQLSPINSFNNIPSLQNIPSIGLFGNNSLSLPSQPSFQTNLINNGINNSYNLNPSPNLFTNSISLNYNNNGNNGMQINPDAISLFQSPSKNQDQQQQQSLFQSSQNDYNKIQQKNPMNKQNKIKSKNSQNQRMFD